MPPQRGPRHGGSSTPLRGGTNQDRSEEDRSPSPLGDNTEAGSARAPPDPPSAGTTPTPVDDHHMRREVDGMKRQMGDMRHQIGEMQSQLGEFLGFVRAQATATQSPPPKIASTFAAVTATPDPSGQARRDFQSAISKLQPYAGQYDEATLATYPTPYAFTQKVEFIAERSKGQVDDETLIGAVAGILAGESLTWYTGQFPSGTLHPALHSWASFRDLFLAEHMDPDQSSISADNLLGDKRCVQMHPGRHSLTEYIRVFQQEMSLLATSASISQPNAPGPPNEAWKKEFFWAGLHPAVRGDLASERSKLRDTTTLKTRALQVAAGFDEEKD